MSTAAIVAAKSAKRQEAEEKRKAETLEDPPAPVQPAHGGGRSGVCPVPSVGVTGR